MNENILHLALINGKLFQVSETDPNVISRVAESAFAGMGYSWTATYTYEDGILKEVIPTPPTPTLSELKAIKLQQLEAQLYDAFESGYLGLYRAHETNQAQYARNLQLANEAVNLGVMAESDTVQWFGKSGVQSGTVTQYRQFMVQYGMWVSGKMTAYYSKQIAINEAQNEQELNEISVIL